ncbi:hypothetical protein GF342_03370 [Candidatus Woesearchaeota archaeon]|nr:hypothetical protein [Candidatus Woesearchaeota archaeon]
MDNHQTGRESNNSRFRSNIPFEITKGHRCGSTCIRIAHEHFGLPAPSLQSLDDHFQRHGRNWIHLVQIAAYFSQQGFPTAYWLNPTLAKEFLHDEQAVYKRLRPESVRRATRYSNSDLVRKALHETLQKEYLDQPPEDAEIREHLHKGIVMCALDNAVLKGEEQLKGHHAILTGLTDEHAYYHNVGPDNAQPDKPLPRELFFRAIRATNFVDYSFLAIRKPDK